MYNPYQTYQQPQTDNGIVWVQGESGAKSFFVSAGKSVLLMDSEEQRFYIKSADVSGMPLPLRIFEYSEIKPNGSNSAVNITPDNYITREEFEAKIAEITAKKKGVKSDE